MVKKVVFYSLILFSFVVFSQEKQIVIQNDTTSIVPKKINSQDLNAYKVDKNFDYEESIAKEEPTFLERFFNWMGRQFLRFLEWIFGVKYAKGIFANILMALPYLVAAIVLFLIIKFFIKVNIKWVISNAQNKNIVQLSEDENLIKHANFEELISKAIKDQNYRLAIRYFYLKILKQLTEIELIKWEIQKTNEDYIKELSEKRIKEKFKSITRLYDFVWYGNFKINESQFSLVKLDFNSLEKEINNQKIG